MAETEVPTHKELLNPLLKALHELGGSGSIDEITQTVIEEEDISDAVAEVLHNPEKSSQTELEYRLAWSRTYLKKYGVLDNPSRGVWVIRPAKRDVTEVDPDEVVRTVRQQNQDESQDEDSETSVGTSDELPPWHEKLHQILTQELSPSAFERLTKQVLRQSGFTQLEVTGRSGDGGVDGTGIMQSTVF